jgi:predicted transposase/invertase (TIGR01784 family)
MQVTHTRYIDPMVDAAFKRIFGTEINKDLLIAFLNEIFRGRRVIVDLVFNKNEYPGETSLEGGAIFDLTCTDEGGNQFLIEVQRGRQKYFKQRAIFYTSRLVTSQVPKGRRSKWGYALTAIYLIALLENPLTGHPSGQYLHDVCLIDRNTKEIFYEDLGYIIIELSTFVKKEEELETDLDKWLYLLKHLQQFTEMPELFNKPIFEKLFAVAEYSNLTKNEKRMYDHSMKYKWDNENVLDYALNEGIEKGIEKGIEIGYSEAKKTIAAQMKHNGFALETIRDMTGLSIAEIKALE